jgi:hypothetical protein
MGIFVTCTLINRALEARECRCVRLVSAPAGRRTGSRSRERARRSSWPTAGFPDASAIVRGLLAIRHQRPCATNSTCPPRLKWTANAGTLEAGVLRPSSWLPVWTRSKRSPAHRPSCCVHLGMRPPSPEWSRLLSWNNLSGLPRQQRHCPSVAHGATGPRLPLRTTGGPKEKCRGDAGQAVTRLRFRECGSDAACRTAISACSLPASTT